MQRPDTSHGLVGERPNLSPRSNGIKVALVPNVDLSVDAEASTTTKRDQAGHSPRRHKMRTYNIPHAYYCDVDLHARSLFLHVLDHKGQTP